MKQIESIEAFEAQLQHSRWRHIAVQGLDLSTYTQAIQNILFEDCVFLGCELEPEADYYLLHHDVALFPKLKVPYEMYRNKLYSQEDLYANFDWHKPKSYTACLDYKVYRHFLETGKGQASSIHETLARRLHDHAITDALTGFLSKLEDEREVVAIMGGHGMLRGAEDYNKVARIAKALCEEGYLLISGGGPGAMEATHLGAWLADRPQADLDSAIEILAQAPSYKDKLWLAKAFQVIERFPRITKYDSLGIPTWLYGHEPPTPFASLIAKYFANSVREEGLLAIAKGGVIFAPGSAGTIQEVFQDACQNHYLSFGLSSPMVFLNTSYWTKERPVYPLLQQMVQENKYLNLLLSIYDEEQEVLAEIRRFKNGK